MHLCIYLCPLKPTLVTHRWRKVPNVECGCSHLLAGKEEVVERELFQISSPVAAASQRFNFLCIHTCRSRACTLGGMF